MSIDKDSVGLIIMFTYFKNPTSEGPMRVNEHPDPHHSSSVPLSRNFSKSTRRSIIASALQAPMNSNLHTPIDTSEVAVDNGEALVNDRRPSFDTSDTGIDSGSDQISIYVVRDGDTLSSIAKMFGVSENTIRWSNDLTPKSTLKKDMQLVILPISGVKYVVKKGDTVKSIAASFNSAFASFFVRS